MALFKKKGKSEEIPQLPELPRLPELPELREMDTDNSDELPQLPAFPSNSLGNKFSQNTIKEAVTGRKRGEEVEADEFAEDEDEQMMRRPLVREQRDSYPRRFPSQPPMQKEAPVSKETEPMFIRIDKFEENAKIFEDVKKQISEIERMFSEIKEVKEEEEKELEDWEKEIKEIKEKIERIDDNIFSKVE